MDLVSFVICSLLVLLPATAFAQPAETEIALLPLGRGFLTVSAQIAGHEGTLLFDTGGGVSTITPEFAAKIDCKPWGQVTGFRMTGQRLDMQRCDDLSVHIGGYQSEPGTLAVFDLGKVLPSTMKHIDGTIALNIFASHTVRFSYSHRSLRVDDSVSIAESLREHGTLVHIVRDAEGLALTVNLPVSTPDGIAWFELDSGNTSSWVIVGKHLAKYFQLAPQSTRPQPIKLQLVNGIPFSGQAQVLDTILDGNLGASFLQDYDVTLDLAHKLAWVTSPAQQPEDRNQVQH